MATSVELLILLDRLSQEPPVLDQSPAILRSDGDAFGQLATEDLILDLEELDLLRQHPIRGSGEHQQEGLEDGLHGGTIANYGENQGCRSI